MRLNKLSVGLFAGLISLSVGLASAATSSPNKTHLLRTIKYTTISYVAHGQSVSQTQYIDGRIFRESGGTSIVPRPLKSQIATSGRLNNTKVVSASSCDDEDASDTTDCSDGVGGDDGGGSDSGDGPSEGGPSSGSNQNPNPSPPDPPAVPPSPPASTVPQNVGTVVYTQYYGNGWTQTTTYNRPIYPDGTTGSWGNPVVSQNPPKK